ncbi:unnamed protein product, partial [Iphiclides podalirius]
MGRLVRTNAGKVRRFLSVPVYSIFHLLGTEAGVSKDALFLRVDWVPLVRLKCSEISSGTKKQERKKLSASGFGCGNTGQPHT